MMSARVSLVVCAAVLLLGTATLSGCTGGPPKGPVDPGVEFATLGGAEVVGYLSRADDAWVVLDAEPNTSGESTPTVLATLVPGSVDEVGIQALDGRYVWAAGRSSDDDDDAPKITVDGIDTAVEPE